MITRVAHGDGDAFASLYERYFDGVFRYLAVALHSQDIAEDLTQQVFLRAFERAGSFEGRRHAAFRHWLFRIVRNAAIDHLRVAGRTTPMELGDARRARELEAVRQRLATPDTPLIAEDMRVLMACLDEKHRELLVFHYVLDWSFADIATLLDDMPGTVRRRHDRALQKLRSQLKDPAEKSSARHTRDRLSMCQIAGPRRLFVASFTPTRLLL